jgi:hypothetical protein
VFFLLYFIDFGMVCVHVSDMFVIGGGIGGVFVRCSAYFVLVRVSWGNHGM